MTAVTTTTDVTEIRGAGCRVHRPDGTSLTVLPRLSGEGWAVFDGMSTETDRTLPLGYPGSWRQHREAAIDWARRA